MNGITFCGLSIALANGYFDGEKHLNTNLNTASEKDLNKAIEKAWKKKVKTDRDVNTVARHKLICKTIVKKRMDSSEGFIGWKDLETAPSDPKLVLTKVETELFESALKCTYDPDPLPE